MLADGETNIFAFFLPPPAVETRFLFVPGFGPGTPLRFAALVGGTESAVASVGPSAGGEAEADEASLCGNAVSTSGLSLSLTIICCDVFARGLGPGFLRCFVAEVGGSGGGAGMLVDGEGDIEPTLEEFGVSTMMEDGVELLGLLSFRCR